MLHTSLPSCSTSCGSGTTGSAPTAATTGVGVTFIHDYDKDCAGHSNTATDYRPPSSSLTIQDFLSFHCHFKSGLFHFTTPWRKMGGQAGNMWSISGSNALGSLYLLSLCPMFSQSSVTHYHRNDLFITMAFFFQGSNTEACVPILNHYTAWYQGSSHPEVVHQAWMWVRENPGTTSDPESLDQPRGVLFK